MVLRNFVFFQEALSEFEVVNMEGKTSDALTVCTNLSWKKKQINIPILHFWHCGLQSDNYSCHLFSLPGQ